MWHCLHDPRFRHFDTTLGVMDTHTHTHKTCDDGIYPVLRGKNKRQKDKDKTKYFSAKMFRKFLHTQFLCNRYTFL